MRIFGKACQAKTPNDRPRRYRPIVLYHTEEQKKAAETLNGLVVEISPYRDFYPAPPYFADFYAQHQKGDYADLVLDPLLETIKGKLRELIQDLDRPVEN